MISGADGTAVGAGAQNTLDIIANACHINDGITSAAEICDNYILGDYDEWFLTSKDELNLMYILLKANSIGGFTGDWYYSSTESSHDFAWNQNFAGGTAQVVEKHFGDKIRPVRAF